MPLSTHTRIQNSSIFIFIGLFLLLACQDKVLLKNVPEEKAKGDSLLTMAEQLCGSDTDLATLYLNTARSMINEDEEIKDYARYQYIKGRICYYRDEYLQSISHIDTSIRLLENTGYRGELAKAYAYFGASQAQMGNYPTAIEYSLKSIEIKQELGVSKPLAASYNFLGNIYLEQKDFKNALRYNDLALKLSHVDSISLLNANVLSSRGAAFMHSGNLKKAEFFIEKAYDIRVSCAYIRHIASSLHQLADLRYLQGRYDESEKILFETEKIYIELGEKTGLFNVYNSLTKVFFARKDLEKASYFGEKTYNLSLDINSERHLEKATQALYEIYEKAGNEKAALEFHKKYHHYHNQLISIEKNRLISNIEYNKELEQRIKDNQLLEQKNKLRKQQTLFLLILSVSLAFIVLTLFVINRLKNNDLKHNQKLLEKEKEMAEAKSSLHQKEKIILENDLELKNKELTSKTVELLHQIETLQTLSGRIESLKHSGSKSEVEDILHELKMKTRESVWDEFHSAFNQVHNEFYDRLFEECPDLTSTEIKIAALLKLNLSTKEIAAISYKSESAVKTARHRLRSKLNLQQGDNLLNFLMRI